jgi:membrane protein YqaA with SNARE-associated domain
VYNIEAGTQYITTNFSIPAVLAVFQISELTTGLLAPEIFITWASGFENPWLWLFILANISYLGGLGAYFIGLKLEKMPKVHNWVHVKFEEQFHQLKKFGGLLIIIAAFTPLPYSPICAVAGIIRFPLKSFLIFTISRYFRFLIYGSIIFKLAA